METKTKNKMEISEARTAYLDSPEQLLEDLCPPVNALIQFIKKYTPKAVIGLSGGVDSALTAAIAVKALGSENVYGLMMPAGNVSEDLEYARNHANQLDIDYKVIDLGDIIKSCKHTSDLFGDVVELGNLKARLRMAHLYAQAKKFGGAVLGTGNKSEAMVGYFTKYGDGGVDILPIGQLYKTQVWKLASELKVPEDIVKRAPTAGLWVGQTDEKEMGISYAKLDKILLGHELGFYANKISSVTGFENSIVKDIFYRVKKSQHKREMPPMPEPKFWDPKTRRPSPVLTADVIIKHQGKYVLIERGYEPFKGHLALPGGHVELGQTCEEAAVREAKEETGLDFKLEGLLGVYSDPTRDPRGHYATVVFYGSGSGTLKAGDDAKEAILVDKSSVRNLTFDHGKIWEDYIKWVKH